MSATTTTSTTTTSTTTTSTTTSPPTMSMTVSEARARLPELLDRVLTGDEVTITRHGTPVAVVVRPDTLRVRRADQAFAQARRVHDLVVQGRVAPLGSSGGLSAERAEELVVEVDAGRRRSSH